MYESIPREYSDLSLAQWDMTLSMREALARAETLIDQVLKQIWEIQFRSLMCFLKTALRESRRQRIVKKMSSNRSFLHAITPAQGISCSDHCCVHLSKVF